jgi:hypothetical protein
LSLRQRHSIHPIRKCALLPAMAYPLNPVTCPPHPSHSHTTILPVSQSQKKNLPATRKSLKISSKAFTIHPCNGYVSNDEKGVRTTDTVMIVPCLRVILHA